jgi:hypothetical protein
MECARNPLPAWRLIVPAGFVAIATTLLLGCSDHDHTTAPVETVIADSLVFTQDATIVAVGTTPLVCCGLYDPGFVNERAMRIVLYDPANQKPGWQILVLVDRAQAGATTILPTSVVPPSKVPAVSMFAATLGNELSSDAEGSAGTITVHSFSCDATKIQIHFSVDATLGSELGGGATMDVTGAFQATFPAASCP